MAKLPKRLDYYKPGIQNYCYTLEDGVRVNPSFKDCVLPNIIGTGSKCVHDLFKEAMTLGGDRPFLGTHDAPTSPYVWKSFNEIYDLVKKFGSGLHSLEGVSQQPFANIGIYGKNCPEWLVTQYACFSYRLVSTPLYDTLGGEALSFICHQAELPVVVCDTAAQALKLLGVIKSCSFLKHLVIMNSSNDLTALKAKDIVQVHTFNEVVALGEKNPLETMASEPDDLVLICYTSGTTGLPKGVMVPNKMMLASLNNNILNSGRDILTENDVYLSYLPLAHIFEQMFLLLAIFNRARIGFYSGDPRSLSDDAKMLKPTLWTTVPRVLIRIYEEVQKKIGDSNFKKRVFNAALSSKLNSVDRGDLSKNTLWDLVFFSKIRALFGGSIRVIVCGGAPLPMHVLKFTRAAFSCWVFEGYGSTETAGSLSSAVSSDRDGGHVGAPVPGLRVKLADIPSMGIVASRDGRGEVCVKGPSCTPGYYKDPESTDKMFDKDGWLCTGDVAVWTEKNSLKIVDRCKHIFKLSQGEYVAPEKIEAVYAESPLVSQVFVDGDTEQAHPVAIVVPDTENLVKHLNSCPSSVAKKDNPRLPNGHTPKENGVDAAGEDAADTTFLIHGIRMTLEELCEYKPAVTAVLSDIAALGEVRGLKGFEKVRTILLSPIPFTVDNGMLTPTMKAAREKVRQVFASSIRSLYQNSGTASS